MADLTLYVHPTCTSCRKAQEFLRDNETPFVRRDYFKERFTVEELRTILAEAGLTPQEVLSKRAKAYATLVGDRDLSDEELLALMVQEPTLLRRPLAVRGDQTAIGFDKAGLTALSADQGRSSRDTDTPQPS